MWGMCGGGEGFELYGENYVRQRKSSTVTCDAMRRRVDAGKVCWRAWPTCTWRYFSCCVSTRTLGTVIDLVVTRYLDVGWAADSLVNARAEKTQTKLLAYWGKPRAKFYLPSCVFQETWIFRNSWNLPFLYAESWYFAWFWRLIYCGKLVQDGFLPGLTGKPSSLLPSLPPVESLCLMCHSLFGVWCYSYHSVCRGVSF